VKSLARCGVRGVGRHFSTGRIQVDRSSGARKPRPVPGRVPSQNAAAAMIDISMSREASRDGSCLTSNGGGAREPSAAPQLFRAHKFGRQYRTHLVDSTEPLARRGRVMVLAGGVGRLGPCWVMKLIRRCTGLSGSFIQLATV